MTNSGCQTPALRETSKPLKKGPSKFLLYTKMLEAQGRKEIKIKYKKDVFLRC